MGRCVSFVLALCLDLCWSCDCLAIVLQLVTKKFTCDRATVAVVQLVTALFAATGRKSSLVASPFHHFVLSLRLAPIGTADPLGG